MKTHQIMAACLMAGCLATGAAYASEANIPLKLDDMKQAISHIDVTIGDLKQAISQIEQRENRASDEITVNIRNQRVRLFSDNKTSSPAIWSFDAYRIGASDDAGVFDHSIRVPVSELKSQLDQANQAGAENVAVSIERDRLTITPTTQAPDGTNTGTFIVRLADVNAVAHELQTDASQVEVSLNGIGSNDGLLLAVPSQNPAVATVYLVNYEGGKTK